MQFDYEEENFQWDEAKRQQTIEKHGVDILYAARIFKGEVLTRIDDREDYGEQRYISLGLVEDEPYVVVYTERNGAVRLITAWKGGRLERSAYEKGINGPDRPDEGSG